MVRPCEYNFVSAFSRHLSWLTARHSFHMMALCTPTHSQQKLLGRKVHISGTGSPLFTTVFYNFIYLNIFLVKAANSSFKLVLERGIGLLPMSPHPHHEYCFPLLPNFCMLLCSCSLLQRHVWLAGSLDLLPKCVCHWHKENLREKQKQSPRLQCWLSQG